MATKAATTEPKSAKSAPRASTSSKSAPKSDATKADVTKTVAEKSPVAKSTPSSKAAPKNAAPAKAPSASSKPLAGSKPKAKPAPRRARGEHVDRIWDLADKIGVCMFITWDGERQRSRPLQANVDHDEHAIYFLTDADSHKDEQVEKFPTVTLAFADIPHSKYVSITGQAVVTNDRAKIKDLWSPFAQAWWDNADDPAIRVIKVTPEDAEFWDSPGRVVSAISMLAAAVTRRSPKIGENAKVKL